MSVTPINLTPNGPQLPRLVPGLWRLPDWNLTPADLLNWIHACLDLGLNAFDLADIYGNYTCEARFGEALALDPSIRGRMKIITKCGIKLVSPNRPEHRLKMYDTGKAHITASIENSLKQLKTDYVDLILIHRPDPLMDAQETATALTQLREDGKILYAGVSNFNPAQFDLLASRLNFPLVTNQIELSATHLEPLYDDTLDHLQRLRIAPMAWSPLGGGGLFTAQTEQAIRLRETMSAIGEELGGGSLDQVALAWLMRHPANIIPVLGTGKLERIKAAIAAERLPLSREQWFAILEASRGEEVP